MSTTTLTIDIQSYWHPGTGRGSGFHLDALTHAGADGLPRLPGRTLKGLLRDALLRAETWGWAEVPSGTTEALFGSRLKERRGHPDDNLSTPGCLRVGDAVLAPEVARYLASPAGRPLVAGLYREHFSTAIDADSGVAREHSLRGMQILVPLTLHASLTEVTGAAQPLPDWRHRLQSVFPLITAVGAHRTRGFGRARLYWQEG